MINPRNTGEAIYRVPSYYADVFGRPEALLREAARKLAGVDFDTIVVRGLSGILLGTLLARRMHKNLLVVRRPQEVTHYGNSPVGVLGQRWIFLDDFMATGYTFRMTYRMVYALASNGYPPLETRFIGAYLFREAGAGVFHDPNYRSLLAHVKRAEQDPYGNDEDPE